MDDDDMAAAPTVSRSLMLSFRGDWGAATLHAICGWLSQEMLDRIGPRSRVAIWNGHGFMDNVRAVEHGEVDLAVATPAASLRMAFEGLGPFSGAPLTELRALATLPQRDRLALAVDGDLGVASFRDIITEKPALRIATPPDDGVNTVGLVARRLMSASGIDEDVLRSWGGGYVDCVRPGEALRLFSSDAANAVFHEAIFAEYWQVMVGQCDPTFVPLEDAALARVEADLHWPRASLPIGHFPTLHEELPVLEFSDFVVLVRSDMPNDVAHLMTWCLCERRGELERRYHHMESFRSPLTYPISPAEMCTTPIPLHPGAEEYYRSAGHLGDRPGAGP